MMESKSKLNTLSVNFEGKVPNLSASAACSDGLLGRAELVARARPA